MRLIYISHWRFPSDKTHTAFALRTCSEFAALGWEVELWIPRRRNPDYKGENLFQQYHLKNHFRIRKLPCIDLLNELGTLGFILMVATFSLSVWWKLGREKGAIVYAHDMRDTILPAFRKNPLFIEIHDFYESSWRGLNRFVLRHATGLIATNRLKAEHIVERYGYPPEQILIQQNVVDAEQFDISETREEARKKLGLPADRQIALYAGHLYSWKGVDTLVRAAHFLPENVWLYMVGGTPHDRARLQKLVAGEKLPRIEFVEHQPHEKIPLYLRAADVLVLPNTAKEEASRVETSPVKLFEYLASGTSVVASDLPSIREIVSEKEVMFAQPDNPRSFAESIEKILKDPQSAERTQAGLHLAQKSSWEARATNISNFIHNFV